VYVGLGGGVLVFDGVKVCDGDWVEDELSPRDGEEMGWVTNLAGVQAINTLDNANSIIARIFIFLTSYRLFSYRFYGRIIQLFRIAT
jgi:hypothetical protein